jgi:type IV pilus assembly protein PilA
MQRRRPDEHGFTLIELMIVVLIIGILIAVALPTFLGARSRAQNRKVQAQIRNTFATEKVHYAQAQAYSEDPADLQAIEPGMSYATGDVPAAVGPVYLHVHPAPTHDLFLSARSETGTCYYLRDIPNGGTTYATSGGCGVADVQSYSQVWSPA